MTIKHADIVKLYGLIWGITRDINGYPWVRMV